MNKDLPLLVATARYIERNKNFPDLHKLLKRLTQSESREIAKTLCGLEPLSLKIKDKSEAIKILATGKND